MNYQKIYSLNRYGINLLNANASLGGIIQGSIGRVQLLVDTGASYTIISTNILTKLGYDLKNTLGYSSFISGKGSTSLSPIIQLSWFNCLGQNLKKFPVIAYNIPPQLRVNGLLGMDFLIQCQGKIDVAKAEIYF